MSRIQDAVAVLRSLLMVANAGTKMSATEMQRIWSNSSVREIMEQNIQKTKQCGDKIRQNPKDELSNLMSTVKETAERLSVVAEGFKQFSGNSATTANTNQQSKTAGPDMLDGLDVASITLKELEHILSERNKQRVAMTALDTEKIDPLKMEVARLDPTTYNQDEKYIQEWMKYIAAHDSNQKDIISERQPVNSSQNVEQKLDLPELSAMAKQRKVPSSRLGRLASFGGLFAGLGFGTVNELTKGALGLGGAKNLKEALLSPANAQRIVDTLCKVRGAALKIGQILSIQDTNIVSPELAKAFERVRQAADYMPDWQVKTVLSSELGANWRQKLKSFDEKPFAAASIGQVHRGVLKNGTEIAIKIQYPGVAQSIESDIDNLVSMLKVWDVFPPGIFIDNIVKVAKRELAWEVDYIREAEYTHNVCLMLSQYPEYRVPKVIPELTTKKIITTELVPGIPVDKCFDLEYSHRKFIGESIFKLCLRELFEMRCMQTDPNWSNFLYDTKSKRLMLIDFGSTRFYSELFIDNYRNVIESALKNDQNEVLRFSKEMGFLTGYETKQMEAAHVNAVMILGEMFMYSGEFDFGKQEMTKRIAELVPTMIAHRLTPPPEEIYSIHRKLSGVFLLLSRLNVKFDCRPYYHQIVKKR